MSEIGKTRAVGASNRHLVSLMCALCRHQLIDPVLTHCCRELFCSDCVDHWLIGHDYCPSNCRTLTAFGVSPAPRLITNWLNDLKIKSNFETNDCKICGLREDIDSEHNCVEDLMIRIERSDEENKRLKNEISGLKRKIEKFQTNTTNNGVFGSNVVRQLGIALINRLRGSGRQREDQNSADSGIRSQVSPQEVNDEDIVCGLAVIAVGIGIAAILRYYRIPVSFVFHI